MGKIIVIILIVGIVFSAIGITIYQQLSNNEEQIFQVGDVVCLKDDQEWRGPIHRITRCDNSTRDIVYHIKVLCGQMKGHVVIRHKKDVLCQLIPDPR